MFNQTKWDLECKFGLDVPPITLLLIMRIKFTPKTIVQNRKLFISKGNNTLYWLAEPLPRQIPDSAELAEPLPGRIQTARGWQNLCREESRLRGAGRISAGKNPDGVELAESLPGRIHVDSDRHGVCPYMRGRINVGGGQQITPRNLSLHTGTNQCGYRTDSKSPLGVCPYMWGRINVGAF